MAKTSKAKKKSMKKKAAPARKKKKTLRSVSAGEGCQPFKHIILGIDGTWQSAASDVFHSNVYSNEYRAKL